MDTVKEIIRQDIIPPKNKNKPPTIEIGLWSLYTYDGDGALVTAMKEEGTTVYIGGYYEELIPHDSTPNTIRKYYNANGQKVAMRENGALFFLLSDHLGSTSLTMDTTGNITSETRYLPFGETRYSSGTTPTDYQYTGQREESGLGLYDYKARWYDPVLGRFIQPDTLVPDPGSHMAYDRYAYVYNNPMRYTDPSGYAPWDWEEIKEKIDNTIGWLEDRGLWTPAAPYYMVPVMLGKAQDKGFFIGEKSEALGIANDWYYEIGEADRVFGEKSQITRALMNDEGVQKARERFIQFGCKDISGDEAYQYEFKAKEAGREFLDVLLRWDWSTSFVGSYQVEIEVLETRKDSYLVELRVTNTTGWESATRLFPKLLKADEKRNDPGPGGNLSQVYSWEENISR